MSQISVVSDIVELQGGAYKLIVTTTGDGMPSAVFAIECLPKSADPKNVNYRFSHVCSLGELVEFPDEETAEMCYFRTNEIEMIFDSPVIAGQTLENLLKDINKLVLLYNQMSDLEIKGTTITISGSTEPGTDGLLRVYYTPN
jgi:ABC-type microcin C transport system duplicated ATPase subunit YejF